MGAHDWIDERARCARCDREHAGRMQFDFRFPDYHDAVSLHRGRWVDGPDLELGEVTSSGYVRVRPPDDGPIIVVEGLDLYSMTCECNAPLIAGVVVDVNLTLHRMRLVELRWLDATRFHEPLPPAHYVPEEWVADAQRAIPPTYEERRALFSDHIRRTFGV